MHFIIIQMRNHETMTCFKLLKRELSFDATNIFKQHLIQLSQQTHAQSNSTMYTPITCINQSRGKHQRVLSAIKL